MYWNGTGRNDLTAFPKLRYFIRTPKAAVQESFFNTGHSNVLITTTAQNNIKFSQKVQSVRLKRNLVLTCKVLENSLDFISKHVRLGQVGSKFKTRWRFDDQTTYTFFEERELCVTLIATVTAHYIKFLLTCQIKQQQISNCWTLRNWTRHFH